MSREGLKVALAFGEALPEFANLQEARNELFRWRGRKLSSLIEAAEATNMFVPDFSAESLKRLEAWYFDLWERNSFEEIRTTREEFERWMSVYLGAVIVQNNPEFSWVVQEYPFMKGRYQLGVQGRLVAIMVGRITDLYARQNNKRRLSLWRQFGKYARGQV